MIERVFGFRFVHCHEIVLGVLERSTQRDGYSMKMQDALTLVYDHDQVFYAPRNSYEPLVLFCGVLLLFSYFVTV